MNSQQATKQRRGIINAQVRVGDNNINVDSELVESWMVGEVTR